MKWVTESRMAELCELARSTWQSWVRERLFELPPNGAYRLGHCLEVALVAAVREQFSLSETKSLWTAMRESGEAARLVEVAEGLPLAGDERFDLVIDPAFGEIALATDETSLSLAIVAGEDRPRLVRVVPLGAQIRRIKTGFDRIGNDQDAVRPRRGRPRRTPATVIELRPRR